VNYNFWNDNFWNYNLWKYNLWLPPLGGRRARPPIFRLTASAKATASPPKPSAKAERGSHK
jgi:hypothetical protein